MTARLLFIFTALTFLSTNSFTKHSKTLPPTAEYYKELYPNPSDKYSSEYWLNNALDGPYKTDRERSKFEQLERRNNLTKEEFIEEYAQWGKPVIVTNSINDWDWDEVKEWTAVGLRERFPGEVHPRYPRVGEEVSE